MPKSKRKRRSHSKCGFFGVRKVPSGKYEAVIRIDKKIKYIGTSYDTAKQAAKAFDKESIRVGRPLSKLNFPKKAPVGYTPIQKALHSTNTVGYRGVYKESKNFFAQTTIAGKYIYIGSFATAKEAAIGYDRAVLKANGSTSLLNFPGMVHNLDVEPKRKKYTLSASGYRGVAKKPNGRFQAMIYINRKPKTVGTFGTAIAAALAYDQAAIKAGKKKSSLNFPEGEKKQKKQEKQKKKKKTQTTHKTQKPQKPHKPQKTQNPQEAQEPQKIKRTKKKELSLQEYTEMLKASM